MTLELSLTGPASHTVDVPAGQGSLRIGPVVPGAPRPDLVVAPDDALDWSAFDGLTVPAGYPWPRVLRYQGADPGFLTWSERRPIEQFHWVPTTAMTVDAGAARIDHFTLSLRDTPLEIVLPATTSVLTVNGDPALLRATLPPGGTCPYLYVHPDTRPARDAPPLRLPPLPALRATTGVYVGVAALRQPFDCASLTQFPHLTAVRLSGHLAGLDALAGLPRLERLQLADCPDLTGLPPLGTWPALRALDATNIERGAGQDLRRQLKEHRVPHASVTRLRTAEWFEHNHGLPFGTWPRATARRATTAFRAAETADDPEAGIRGFVRAVNDLPGIGTIERDDAAEAVVLLAARAKIPEERALSWFDSERDF